MRAHLILAMAAAMAIPAAPALADPPPWAPAHGRRAKDAARYDDRGRYLEPVVITREDHVWRGDDGRYYCRRDNGTTGLVVGAALGAVIGNQLADGRERTLGTILGATGGALIGQRLDEGDLRCR